MAGAEFTRDVEWDFRTENLEAYRAKVASLLKPFAIIGKPCGYYDAKLVHRTLHRSELTVIDYGEEVVIDTDVMRDFYILQVPLKGGYGLQGAGRPSAVGQGDAHLIHEAMPLRMECSADLSLLVFKFDKAHFRALAVQEARRRSIAQQSFGHVIPLSSEAGQSLGRIVEFIIRESLREGLFSVQPASGRYAEELLLSAMLAAFQASFCARDTVQSHAIPYYVRRAEDFIETHLREGFTLGDIVAASRVSARSLFYGFGQAHGMGPWAWARERRLEAVRQCLISRHPGPIRITDVALDLGFAHLGHFSAAYRLKFGETPSETLANARLDCVAAASPPKETTGAAPTSPA